MSAYESEEQQVEALKKWWKENGVSVVVGAAIGLGAVLGWQGWQGHLVEKNAVASQLLEAVVQSDKEQKKIKAQQIFDEYDDTIYADFAAFDLAKDAVNSGNNDQAADYLQRVIDRSGDSAIVDLARLRLARVLLDSGKGADAEKQLSAITSSVYQAEAQAVQGDIALAAGDKKKAKEAYEKALAGKTANSELLKLKLDDLAAAN